MDKINLPWQFALASIALMLAPSLVKAQNAIERPANTTRTRLMLADALGAIHYLTVTCSGLRDQSWRARMSELLSLEPLSAYERDDLVAAFNHGYRQEKYYFPQCNAQTVNRILAQKRIIAEQGQILSTALADPYLH